MPARRKITPKKIRLKPVKSDYSSPVAAPRVAAAVTAAVTALENNWLAPEEHFSSIEEAELYKRRVDANIKLVQYMRISGDLIRRELVREACAENARKTLEAINAFIDTAAPELAALTDPRLVRSYLIEKFFPIFDALDKAWLPPEN